MLVIGSEHFTWNASTATFSAEASELEQLMKAAGYTRLDSQSGQWGFHMQSHKTGRTVWFRRVQEHRDREGDLTHVEFHAYNPVDSSWLKLLVYND